MRSIESSGIAVSCAVDSSLSDRRIPSTSTSVFWSPVMPKPRRSSCLLGEPLLSRTLTRLNWAMISARSEVALFLMSSAVITVTPTGRSRLLSGKRVAVMTTASSCAKQRETDSAAIAPAAKRCMRTSPASFPTPNEVGKRIPAGLRTREAWRSAFPRLRSVRRSGVGGGHLSPTVAGAVQALNLFPERLEAKPYDNQDHELHAKTPLTA